MRELIVTRGNILSSSPHKSTLLIEVSDGDLTNKIEERM